MKIPISRKELRRPYIPGFQHPESKMTLSQEQPPPLVRKPGTGMLVCIAVLIIRHYEIGVRARGRLETTRLTTSSPILSPASKPQSSLLVPALSSSTDTHIQHSLSLLATATPFPLS